MIDLILDMQEFKICSSELYLYYILLDFPCCLASEGNLPKNCLLLYSCIFIIRVSMKFEKYILFHLKIYKIQKHHLASKFYTNLSVIRCSLNNHSGAEPVHCDGGGSGCHAIRWVNLRKPVPRTRKNTNSVDENIRGTLKRKVKMCYLF